MRITENAFNRAVETLCQRMHAPRPGQWKGGWDVELDGKWVEYCLKPAFLKALEEIEEVDPCYGFDLDGIRQGQG